MSNWPLIAPGAIAGPWGYTDETNQVTTVSWPSANTKGAWVELAPAATEEISDGVLGISWINGKSSNTTILVDVAVGAIGAERIVIENVALHVSASQNAFTTLPLPRIPLGAAIYGRTQSRLSTANCDPPDLWVMRSGRAFVSPLPYSFVTSYGGDTGSTRGTAVSCTGTAPGPVVEFVASMPYRCRGLLLAPAEWSDGTYAMRIRLFRGPLLDQPILDQPINMLTSSGALLWLPVTIAAGTRVGLQAQSTASRTIYPTLHAYH